MRAVSFCISWTPNPPHFPLCPAVSYFNYLKTKQKKVCTFNLHFESLKTLLHFPDSLPNLLTIPSQPLCCCISSSAFLSTLSFSYSSPFNMLLFSSFFLSCPSLPLDKIPRSEVIPYIHVSHSEIWEISHLPPLLFYLSTLKCSLVLFPFLCLSLLQVWLVIINLTSIMATAFWLVLNYIWLSKLCFWKEIWPHISPV